MDKENENGNNGVGGGKKGFLVDDAFWDFFNDEESQSFLRNFLRKAFPGLSEEDIEDVITDIKVKYRQPGARRHEVLDFAMLVCFSRRAAIDYVRHIKRKRAGGGVFHDSIEASEEILNLSADPIVTDNREERLQEFVNGLSLAEQQCKGKQLIVVKALQRWLKGGCASESWYDALTEDEVAEFMSLSKGKSLEGKVSATFTVVKKLLRKIQDDSGPEGSFSA